MGNNFGLLSRLELVKSLDGHQGCVNSVAFNENGETIISGSDDSTIKIWDSNRLRLVHSMNTGHSKNIFCARFLPQTNDQIVSCGADGEVRMHDINRNTSPFVCTCASGTMVNRLAIDPSASSVFYSCGDVSESLYSFQGRNYSTV